MPTCSARLRLPTIAWDRMTRLDGLSSFDWPREVFLLVGLFVSCTPIAARVALEWDRFGGEQPPWALVKSHGQFIVIGKSPKSLPHVRLAAVGFLCDVVELEVMVPVCVNRAGTNSTVRIPSRDRRSRSVESMPANIVCTRGGKTVRLAYFCFIGARRNPPRPPGAQRFGLARDFCRAGYRTIRPACQADASTSSSVR